ncbi:MAG: hypothetical protein JW723_14620, partial [Bacteroidales bacterium]|nr:hypothetical protein [Bacteroidales bacterium]
MKKTIFNNGKLLLAAIFLLAIAFNGCEKDKEEELQLPPESAFSIDLSPFADQEKSTAEPEPGTYVNIAIARTAVAFWNIILGTVVAVPAYSYVKAFEYKPVRVSNDKWKWSYEVGFLGSIYTAELYGEVIESDVEWKMYISQQGGFSDFLMYDGKCNIQRTKGYWRLYENPLAPVEFLRIDWTYNWEEKTCSVKYTYTKEGAETRGNYIDYGITTDTDYNVYYDIYSITEDKYFSILYNTTTHEGMIEYDGNP